MAKVLQTFTEREYVSYDEEGNRSVVSENDAFDEDGSIKEGVSAENVTYSEGDDYEGSDAPVGFVEDSADTDDDGKPALKKDRPAV